MSAEAPLLARGRQSVVGVTETETTRRFFRVLILGALVCAIVALVLASISLARQEGTVHFNSPCDANHIVDASCVPAGGCVVLPSNPETWNFALDIPVNSPPDQPPFVVTPITFPQPVGGVFALTANFSVMGYELRCGGDTVTLESHSFSYLITINATQSSPFQAATLIVSLKMDQIPGLTLTYEPGLSLPRQLIVFSTAAQSNVLGWTWQFSDATTITITGTTSGGPPGEDAYTTLVSFHWIQ